MSDTVSPLKKQDAIEIIARTLLAVTDEELGLEREDGESDWRQWLNQARRAIAALEAAGYVIVPTVPAGETVAWGAALLGSADMTLTETGERRELDEWFEDEAELRQAFLAAWAAAVKFCLGDLPDWSPGAAER